MSARKALVLNGGQQEQVQTTDHLDLDVFVAGLATGPNLVGISGKAWRSSTDMWAVASGVSSDALSVSIVDAVTGGTFAPGGKVHQFVTTTTNGGWYYIDSLIEVNTDRSYYARVWMAGISGTLGCFAGFIALDKDLNILTGNGGTFDWALNGGSTPSATGTWYYQTITGEATDTGRFPVGTKYIKPVVVVGRSVAGATTQVGGFEFSDRPFQQSKGDTERYISTRYALIQSATGTGLVATAGTTTLTGTGTQFTKSFIVGDTITVSGETVRTIQSITSDTVLDVTVAFSTTASSLRYNLAANTERFTALGNGNNGFGVTAPKARVELAAGNANRGPFKFNSGAVVTTIVQYLVEMLSGVIYFSPTTTLRQFFLMNGYVTTAVSYTVATGVTKVGVTSTTAARVITLPAANSVPGGFQITITDESNAASAINAITITPAGIDTIVPTGSGTITTAGASKTIYSDGTSKWFNI